MVKGQIIYVNILVLLKHFLCDHKQIISFALITFLTRLRQILGITMMEGNGDSTKDNVSRGQMCNQFPLCKHPKTGVLYFTCY